MKLYKISSVRRDKKGHMGLNLARRVLLMSSCARSRRCTFNLKDQMAMKKTKIFSMLDSHRQRDVADVDSAS
jgi:hypothetical protein